MNDSRAPMTTICVGGPLDGHVAETSEEVTHFDYHVTSDGLELMDGDMILGGCQLELHRYHLRRFMFIWHTGVVWHYSFWMHASEDIAEVAMDLNPSDCHVNRFVDPSLAQTPSPLFRYGGIMLSVN